MSFDSGDTVIYSIGCNRVVRGFIKTHVAILELINCDKRRIKRHIFTLDSTGGMTYDGSHFSTTRMVLIEKINKIFIIR